MPKESGKDRPKDHTCENCGEHQASMWWVGDGGILAVTRYHMQAAWCRCCALKAQLERAREQAQTIPKLVTELARVRCKEAL